MDEREFSGFVEAVRGWFMSDHVPKWKQTPAETAADSYLRVLPSEMRADALEDLIARSKVSRTAWDAANLVAQDKLRSGEPLPAGLAAWAADVLADLRSKPTRKGDPVSGLANRDRIIGGAVEHVAERFDLRPTRNRSKGEHCTAEGGSACDVVGAAANMGYKAIERIWSSYTKAQNK